MKNQNYIIELLRNTQRKGIENVISFLCDSGFFTSAASKKHQNNYRGGLAEHSLAVYVNAMREWRILCEQNSDFAESVPHESVVIASLLHDLCKYDYYPVDDTTNKVQSKAQTPHGKRSVELLESLDFELKKSERYAIRWHMGKHTKDIEEGETLPDFNRLHDCSPLLSLIIRADGEAAHSGNKWDSVRWLNGFTQALGAKDVSALRKCRKRVWLNSLEIIERGTYESQNNKLVILSLNKEIVQETRFYRKEIESVEAVERYNTKIKVQEGDCLEYAKCLHDSDNTDDLCVLNLASYRNPGGGVVNGAGAQEEYLFRCSDYYRSLFQFAHYSKEYKVPKSVNQYPMDRNFGGIFSHGVTVFREKEANGYALIDEPWRVNFVAAAVQRLENKTEKIPDQYVPLVINTIRTIFRIAFVNGQRRLVLGALGCGAFNNPPRHMAYLFKKTLEETEFKGIFKEVHFAIFDDHNALRNNESNIRAFQSVFGGE